MNNREGSDPGGAVSFPDYHSPVSRPAPNLENRVLLLAPSGNDGPLTAGFLHRAGVDGHICRDMTDLLGCLTEGCGALVLAEETLDAHTSAELSRALAKQPSWSDIPVGIVTSRGESDSLRHRQLEAFGRENN